MTTVLGLHAIKSFLHSKGGNLKLQRSRVYATSVFRSVAEEGMANSSLEVDGGTGSSVAGGGAADAVEAAEGEIIATNAGANFFAFSKKLLSHRGCGHGESSPSPSRSPYRAQKKV
jgi:hypothetical protein